MRVLTVTSYTSQGVKKIRNHRKVRPGIDIEGVRLERLQAKIAARAALDALETKERNEDSNQS